MQFFDFLVLELAPDDSRVGRKLVKGVSDARLTGCGHMLVDDLCI